MELVDSYFKGVHAVLLLYDLTEPKTLRVCQIAVAVPSFCEGVQALSSHPRTLTSCRTLSLGTTGSFPYPSPEIGIAHLLGLSVIRFEDDRCSCSCSGWRVGCRFVNFLRLPQSDLMEYVRVSPEEELHLADHLGATYGSVVVMCFAFQWRCCVLGKQLPPLPHLLLLSRICQRNILFMIKPCSFMCALSGRISSVLDREFLRAMIGQIAVAVIHWFGGVAELETSKFRFL